jgi:hypothetical protein
MLMKPRNTALHSHKLIDLDSSHSDEVNMSSGTPLRKPMHEFYAWKS